MKAIICKNAQKKDDSIFNIISEVINKLQQFGIDAEFSEEGVRSDCDLIITIGGDGTILHHGKQAARLGLPLLGINMGRLGFMTSMEVDEPDKFELLKQKNWQITSRMMLDIDVCGETFLALNDVVFLKDIDSKLPEFKVSARGETISELRADGLIISTPTGSTAYALSAGGPIIEPWLDCIEVTPLCAHSLFGRPMILSAANPVTVEYNGADSHAVLISVDGERGIEFKKGDNAVIKKSALRLSLIDLGGGSFHRAISNKLMKPLK
jgi:NAD+ kinase